MYFFISVFTQCSTGCASCYNGGIRSICNYCGKGFWFNNPNCVPCPSNCETCTDDYTCQSCKPQFYGTETNDTCRYTCPSSCRGLGCDDDTGYCKTCPSGWYGFYCCERCEICRKESCELRQCTNRYKGPEEYIAPYSIPCAKHNCITCYNRTFCIRCDDGYYIRPYIMPYGKGEADCQLCSSSFPCGNCDSILNCKTCRRVNEELVCTRCKDGYVLEWTRCMKANEERHEGCYGFDVYGNCKVGYLGSLYDDICNTSCSRHCLRDTPLCRTSDGYCLKGCKEGYWGDQCQERCSKNCRHDNKSYQVCLRNRTCIHGCNIGIGYSDSDCNKVVTVPITTTTAATTANTFTSSDNILSDVPSDFPAGVLTASYYEDESSSFGDVIGSAVTATFIITAVVFVGSIAFFLHRRSIVKTRNEH